MCRDIFEMIIRNTNLSGLHDLIKTIREAANAKVLVGVPASKNSPHEGGINMATLAATHEYGAPSRGIPERSFLRSAIIENQDKITDLVSKGVKSYLEQGKEIDLMFYDRIGLFASNLVKDKIAKGPFKPLADATVKRKGSSKPLVDTGALRQSISWEVRE